MHRTFELAEYTLSVSCERLATCMLASGMHTTRWIFLACMSVVKLSISRWCISSWWTYNSDPSINVTIHDDCELLANEVEHGPTSLGRMQSS